MKRTSLAAMVAALLASCSPFRVDQGVISEIESATAQKGGQPDAVRAALLPPLRAEMPKVPGAPVEPRFDLVVQSVQVSSDRRTLILATAPHLEAAPHALTLTDPSRVGKKEAKAKHYKNAVQLLDQVSGDDRDDDEVKMLLKKFRKAAGSK